MVTGVLGAVTFLPIISVFIDTPVADACDSGTGNRGAPSDHLSPSTIPYETTRPLLRVLQTERPGHLGLLAAALDRTVSFFVELGVGSAEILSLGIRITAALVAANRIGTYS